MSESHHNKIQSLSKNTVDEFSAEFLRCFIKLLKLNHGSKKIEANRFYQEFIMDREHVHLNATKWKSLTSFILYCAQQNIIQIINDDNVINNGEDMEEADEADEAKALQPEVPQGLYIRYIDTFKDALLSQEKKVKNDEEISLKYINDQIKKNREINQDDGSVSESIKSLKASTEPFQPIKISIGKNKVPAQEHEINYNVYSKKINKCGVMVNPVKPIDADGDQGCKETKESKEANTHFNLGAKNLKNPKLKPRKGNVFKVKKNNISTVPSNSN
ncbi:hypothetical protein PACTADRAFT_50498 [Pachysolen tannophilus NRRL Y-2460]|uniref:DNA/RNA-binding protein Kin17 WH-like domain-containing protein n=1 Tax=Pachysolen tannophilus NRRL Y-2460 TaxID=669874 RepID=A0A1E4TS98_PACTA|nr:hypothetical protein PACTADRAFT_50498 [Pachysolen tannophilus NRRL Y-2460]